MGKALISIDISNAITNFMRYFALLIAAYGIIALMGAVCCVLRNLVMHTHILTRLLDGKSGCDHG